MTALHTRYLVRREGDDWLTIRICGDREEVIARSPTKYEAHEAAWLDPFTMPKVKPRRLLSPVTAPIRKEMK